MAYLWKQNWAICLAIVCLAAGLTAGLMTSGIWPDTPLHAVATDRTDNYAMATGYVDDGIEAIYFLDFLTGTLRGAVISNQSAIFQAHYERNVAADVADIIRLRNANMMTANAERRRAGLPPLPEVQLPQNPNYMIVTGNADIRRGAMARTRPGHALIYVAETNTGIVLAYAVPWDQGAHASNVPSGGQLVLWAGEQFSTVLIQTP